jgi:vacuolar-type H+-ATPase subunit I/STV1
MVKLFVKSDIRKVSIALEKVFYHEVYLELGKAGFIHLSRSKDSAGHDIMMDAELKDEEAKSREIISGMEYVMNALNIQPGEVSVHDKIRDTSQDEAFVFRLKSSIERTQKLCSRIQESLDVISERISYLEVLNRMGIDPGAIKKARLVKMVFGIVTNTDWEAPVQENFAVAKAGKYIFGTALPEDISTMLQFLKEYGYTDKSDDIREASFEDLMRRQDILRHRLEVLDGHKNNLRDEKGHALMKLYSVYVGYEEVLKALRMSLFSSRSMFITGWMDITEKQRLFNILQGICGDKFIAIVSEQRDADAPVRLRNIRFLKPFELLVKTMGMPSNSEIDPTPLTAITFVLMFGLMFGDFGQGLVLVLGGIILKRIAKKKEKPIEGLGQAGGILIICGFSAAICGLLYGSTFSSEHIIPALWFHPMEHIMKLFYLTILMGAIFIMAGLCVNIINSLMNSDYTGALLGKRSLAVLILYAAIVLIAVRYTRTGQGPAPWEVGGFIVLPLFLFSLRGVLGPALFKEHKPHSMSEYVIETLLEILEIGLSMLANTISFIRVGAFALSHAGLSIVTYTLAGIADPSMKSVGAIAIITIGNIFIIGLEGLICGIQSMRLEYYEFFSKFFKGDGVAFTPFILKAKTSEVSG